MGDIPAGIRLGNDQIDAVLQTKGSGTVPDRLPVIGRNVIIFDPAVIVSCFRLAIPVRKPGAGKIRGQVALSVGNPVYIYRRTVVSAAAVVNGQRLGGGRRNGKNQTQQRENDEAAKQSAFLDNSSHAACFHSF